MRKSLAIGEFIFPGDIDGNHKPVKESLHGTQYTGDNYYYRNVPDEGINIDLGSRTANYLAMVHCIQCGQQGQFNVAADGKIMLVVNYSRGSIAQLLPQQEPGRVPVKIPEAMRIMGLKFTKERIGDLIRTVLPGSPSGVFSMAFIRQVTLEVPPDSACQTIEYLAEWLETFCKQPEAVVAAAPAAPAAQESDVVTVMMEATTTETGYINATQIHRRKGSLEIGIQEVVDIIDEYGVESFSGLIRAIKTWMERDEDFFNLDVVTSEVAHSRPDTFSSDEDGLELEDASIRVEGEQEAILRRLFDRAMAQRDVD